MILRAVPNSMALVRGLWTIRKGTPTVPLHFHEYKEKIARISRRNAERENFFSTLVLLSSTQAIAWPSCY